MKFLGHFHVEKPVLNVPLCVQKASFPFAIVKLACGYSGNASQGKKSLAQIISLAYVVQQRKPAKTARRE